MNTNSQVID